ncbi:MAG: hypothetical protein ACPLYF_03470, partial [Fervidobacterium sp.]
ATKDNNGYGYKYHVIPEFQSTLILALLTMITLTATVLLGKREKCTFDKKFKRKTCKRSMGY